MAAELARRYGGQILSVDSMKIYRGMDIGTAKPPPDLRREIVHHGIDVTDPWTGWAFTVHDYVAMADRAIGEIAAAGAPVIAVGGTHLYLKALIEGLFAGPGESPEIRARLRARADAEGSAALHAELARLDATAAGSSARWRCTSLPARPSPPCRPSGTPGAGATTGGRCGWTASGPTETVGSTGGSGV